MRFEFQYTKNMAIEDTESRKNSCKKSIPQLDFHFLKSVKIFFTFVLKEKGLVQSLPNYNSHVGPSNCSIKAHRVKSAV